LSESFTQHHIKALDKDIAGYCLIPGDHVRGKKIAQKLDNMRHISSSRGYQVYSGFFRDLMVTVCSTGMGGPQVAIAIEELANMGAHTFIRLGSAGGLNERVGVGDIVIATGAYRGGGTADEYLPKPFPAVPDFEVATQLVRAAREFGGNVFTGPVASVDAFYRPDNTLHNEMLARGGIYCVEMEADTQFIVGMYRRLRCGAAFVLDSGPRTPDIAVKSGKMSIAHHGRDPLFVRGEERLINIGLLATYYLSKL
jgi:uridine phosphorylase